MSVSNTEIADTFKRLADLLEIEGANPFRVRAYRKAARTVGGYGKSMSALIERGEDLSRLPGIGKDLAAMIRELLETGELKLLKQVRIAHPAGAGRADTDRVVGPQTGQNIV